MSDIRNICCAACGGDKGHHDPDGRWFDCVACSAHGEYEAELEPVTLDDLERAENECPCGWDCTGAPEGPRHDCPYKGP
jgi:hypothetical protein